MEPGVVPPIDARAPLHPAGKGIHKIRNPSLYMTTKLTNIIKLFISDIQFNLRKLLND